MLSFLGVFLVLWLCFLFVCVFSVCVFFFFFLRLQFSGAIMMMFPQCLVILQIIQRNTQMQASTAGR